MTMAIALLDINDSNLQLWRGEQSLRSPGYALLDGTQYLFGNAARSAARLRPRDINTRFWWQLNTEPLQPALGPARHSADLVHAHLLDIHRQAEDCTELVLAVPDSMQREQLALLLGIVQESPFTAVGLVSRSVGVASLYGSRGRLFHLEVQLHQGVLTELSQADGQTTLLRSTPLPGCGLLQLQERLIEAIASGFIRQTRFDPRRKADTEQDLYDKLPEALRALENGSESNIEVGGYRARIDRSELLKCGDRLFTAVAAAMGSPQDGDRVLVDPIATLLPGLGERLPGCEALPNEALWQAVSGHREHLVQRGQALNFVTALPTAGTTADNAATAMPAAEAAAETAAETPENKSAGGAAQARALAEAAAPTHLLTGSSASPLRPDGVAMSAGCELYREEGSWRLRGEAAAAAMVNGRPYRAGQALNPGDDIRVNDTHATLIEVLT